MAVLLVLSAGATVFRPDTRPATVALTVAVPPGRQPTGLERSAAVLTAQAEALLAGDEAGWLTGLDPDQPELRKRYRAIYRNLHALDVTRLEYDTRPRAGGTGRVVRVSAHLAYCLSVEPCAAVLPRVAVDLDFTPVDGDYVITRMAQPPGAGLRQPAPWQDGPLSVLRGRRVTVAGPPGQARHLRQVLAVAEKAAAVADRFAGYLGNPQRRYRIYLADEKAWRTWYGGSDRRWWVGYAVPLDSAGSDVVLRAGKLIGDPRQLAVTVQHELGHVATLAGAATTDTGNGWLTEGIAEYIGAYPRPAKATPSRYGMRRAFRGGAPRTIVARPLSGTSSARAVDTFYGLGHFAADCMAQRYGERKLLTFVGLVLRHGVPYDQASRRAYGQPFAGVDRACLTWIRGQVSG